MLINCSDDNDKEYIGDDDVDNDHRCPSVHLLYYTFRPRAQ